MSLQATSVRVSAIAFGVLAIVALLAEFPWLITNIGSSTYLPHGFCFQWNARLLWQHVIADLTIWVSYTVIAYTLVRLVVVFRKEIPFQSIFLAFGAFIVACGFTHLMAIVVLWKPLYWLEGDIKLVTACASLFTAVALPFCLPRLRNTLRQAAVSAANERRFLAAAESSLDSLFLLESSYDEFGTIDDFRFEFVNDVAARLVGWKRDYLIGKMMCEVLPENRTLGLFAKYKRVAETGEAFVEEVRVLAFTTLSASWLKIQAVRSDGGVAVTASDISDRKRMEEERTRAFTDSLIASSPAAVIVVNTDFTVRAVNPAGERMLWYKPAELIGRATPLIFFDPGEVQERALRLEAEFGTFVPLEQTIFFIAQTKGVDHEAEWNFLRKGGSRIAVQVTVTPLFQDGPTSSGFMITAYDISERKRREEYISHISQHDALTGLPTRQLLFDRLEMMLARADRYQTECALLMIDLDHFKKVNDSLGHHAGDELLTQVAARLKASLRGVDTVARMGGDEFVVLLADLNGPEDAQLVADKLRNALADPFTFHEQTTATVGASIGICMYPGCAHDAQSLLRNADVAMYHAKALGGRQIEAYSDDLARLVYHRIEIEAALRETLRTDGFALHYQPEIDLDSGETVGLEALLRWKHARLGNVGPAEFIPIAEEADLIQPIGAWVINKACQDIQTLNQQLGTSLFVAVNLSPCQLEQSDLLAIIDQALVENNLAPSLLEIEITEGVLMKESPKATSTLDGLRNLGVRIAIDDFGTGFSSMSYLLRFEVDRLKIDRSFVRNCAGKSASSTVTSAIIALAHQLKLSVIAEGVETREQADFLKSTGCDLVQGFYYSKPVPFSSIADVIRVNEARHQAAKPNSV